MKKEEALERWKLFAHTFTLWPFEDPVTDVTRWQHFAGLGAMSFRRLSVLNIPCMVLFLAQLGFMVPGVKEWKWNGSIQY